MYCNYVSGMFLRQTVPHPHSAFIVVSSQETSSKRATSAASQRRVLLVTMVVMEFVGGVILSMLSPFFPLVASDIVQFYDTSQGSDDLLRLW